MSSRPPSRRFTPTRITQWLVPALLAALVIGLVAVIVIVVAAVIGVSP
jgi:hypothetical protein